MQDFENFQLKFSSKEVTAWGGLALLKKMLDAMDFGAAMKQWQLPQPGSNRGYRPEQLVEQMFVSIWCGACPLCPCRAHPPGYHLGAHLWLAARRRPQSHRALVPAL